MSVESISKSRLATMLLVLPFAVDSACSGSTSGRDIFLVSGAVTGLGPVDRRA